MPEQTDPTRALIRRAYTSDLDGLDDLDDLDTESGLADVVRRSGRPRHDADAGAEVVALDPRRVRGRFAVVGTFAAAVVTILAVYAASAGTRPSQETGAPTASVAASRSAGAPPSGQVTPSPGAPPSGQVTPSPGASRSAGGPNALPSSCAGAWNLALAGTEFRVTARPEASCPPLQVDRLWVLDAASGNGRVGPGDAVIWPVTPVGGTGPVQAPFTFRPGGWSGPVQGHVYEVIYLDAAAATTAKPGDDAHAAYEHAYTISRHVIA